MRIIADENIAESVVQTLRQHGHDVLSVRETMPGQSDRDILAAAAENARIVLTHDKDFGELAFRSRLPAASGVILLRLSGATPDEDRQRVVNALLSHDDWPGHFSVIDDRRIPMRAMPQR